jgi:hypothetical protein
VNGRLNNYVNGFFTNRVRGDIFRALFEPRATKDRVLHLHECAEYVFLHQVADAKCDFEGRELKNNF